MFNPPVDVSISPYILDHSISLRHILQRVCYLRNRLRKYAVNTSAYKILGFSSLGTLNAGVCKPLQALSFIYFRLISLSLSKQANSRRLHSQLVETLCELSPLSTKKYNAITGNKIEFIDYDISVSFVYYYLQKFANK